MVPKNAIQGVRSSSKTRVQLCSRRCFLLGAEQTRKSVLSAWRVGLKGWIRDRKQNLPASSLAALLGSPQGSSFLEPSPKGSPEVDESVAGAGDPHASSVSTGAAATQKHNTPLANVEFPFRMESNGIVGLTGGSPGVTVWFGSIPKTNAALNRRGEGCPVPPGI